MVETTIKVPDSVLAAVNALAESVPMTRKAAVCLALGSPGAFLELLKLHGIDHVSARALGRAPGRAHLPSLKAERELLLGRIKGVYTGQPYLDDHDHIKLLAERKRLETMGGTAKQLAQVNGQIRAQYEKYMCEARKIDNQILDIIAPNSKTLSQAEHDQAILNEALSDGDDDAHDGGQWATPENGLERFPG